MINITKMAVLLLSIFVGSANATIIRYGQVGYDDNGGGRVVGNTDVGGNDVDISFTGYTRYDGTNTLISGTAGTLANATTASGSTLSDSLSGSDIVLTVNSVVGGGGKLTMTGVGSTLSVFGGNNNQTEAGESFSFIFNEDVRIHHIRVFGAGVRGVEGTVGQMVLGTAGSTNQFTVGTSDSYGTVGTIGQGEILPAGESLYFTTVSASGGWSLKSLVVETVPEAEAFGLSVEDRTGQDVSGQTLVDSDLLHLQVQGVELVESSGYRLIEQASEPSSNDWNSISMRPCSNELIFYRKPQTQWVQLTVTETNQTVHSWVFGLEKGSLSAPPDDPLTPHELTAMMKTGFDVSWYNPAHGNFSEEEVVAIKAAGFGHIRIREDAGVADDAGLFNHLDEQVELVLRHGLIPILCSNGGDANKNASAVAQDEFVDWWDDVALRYQHVSHRLAFDLITEIGGSSAWADWGLLNTFYGNATTAIRSSNPTRNIVYCPNGLNDPSGLVQLTAPVAAGQYYFAEWHIQAGGPMNIFGEKYWTIGTADEKDRIDDAIALADAWSAFSGKPTWFGAWMPGDYSNFDLLYDAEQVAIATYYLQQLKAASIPIAFNAMPHHFYDMDTESWRTDRLPLLEVLNGDAVIDLDDIDGDGLTNAEETGLYGTDPLVADTDGDNIFDNWEVFYGLNPSNPADGDPSANYDDDSGNDVVVGDFDNDGMNSAKEVHYDLNPTNAADALIDTDGDGLNSLQEIIAITDPRKYISRQTHRLNDGLNDLDYDGYSSLAEFALGRDPRLKHGESPWNTVPVTVSDAPVVAYKNWPVVLDVLANDSDTNSDPLSIVEVSGKYSDVNFIGKSKQGGTVSINADNTLLYVPKNNFTGSDTIYYAASDGKGNTSGEIMISVGSSAPPAATALPDEYRVAATGGTIIADGVLSNDTGIANAHLANQAANGTVEMTADGGFSYTPDASFWGWDEFSYVADGIASPVPVTVGVKRSFTDTDADGIDDDWELAYAPNLNAMDETSHSDADGISDLDEYLANTDPEDAVSHFILSWDQLELSWFSQDSMRYRVQGSSDLKTWTDLSGYVDGSVGGVFSAPATNSAGFYRVQMILP